MTVRTMHEIDAIVLLSLSLHLALIHFSTPALRGVRWVAIGYFSTALGLGFRAATADNLSVLAANLLLTFLNIAFYWGIAQLLSQDSTQGRLNRWLLFFFAPTFLTQIYFLYIHPSVAARAITLNLVLLTQAALLVSLLLRIGTPQTRAPRYSLAALFSFWALINLAFAIVSLRNPAAPTLDYFHPVDGRLVLVSVLPGILLCLGFLWLAMTHLQNELEHQSHTDVLTGLLNRRALSLAAAREIAVARRHHFPLSLLLLDLDHFKQINDRHGHAGGDTALARVAQCLTENLRTSDICARIGGEEFVALLPGYDGEHALQAAERVRSAIEALQLEHRGIPIPLTTSIGLADIAPEDDVLEDLIFRADSALYRAKQEGRNRVVAV
jgi:diguanylate cyclase (GGDEF)-like protein